MVAWKRLGSFGSGVERGVDAQVASHRASLRSRLVEPRLPPLPYEQWDDETRAVLPSPSLNIFGTLARHPKLLKRWLVFGNHVLAKSTLTPRDRELLILRTGWRCRAPYEWGQHVVIARASGITDEEITRVASGPGAPGWSRDDAALLRAVDELHDDQTLTDETYAALAARYDEQQLLDIVFTVGQYHLVSMALNTFRVQRDDGVTGVPIPDRGERTGTGDGRAEGLDPCREGAVRGDDRERGRIAIGRYFLDDAVVGRVAPAAPGVRDEHAAVYAFGQLRWCASVEDDRDLFARAGRVSLQCFDEPLLPRRGGRATSRRVGCRSRCCRRR